MTTPTRDDEPTWTEALEGWEPDVDGQGNEGLATAAERIAVERATSRTTSGRDFTGTADEGVLLRTLGPDGQRCFQVTLGFRNYGEALTEADARRRARPEGDRSWWLPFDAAGAAEHLRSCGVNVPAQVAALAAVPA